MPNGFERRVRGSLSPACVVAVVLAASGALGAAPDAAAVNFDRDVRPILSDFCYACHGPDAEAREADLRLDQREGLFRQQDGTAIVVPGSADESELWRRLTAADASEQMPPADFPRRPTAEQIALLRRWIDEGAAWQAHWSFVAPQRSPVPVVRETSWPRTPLDHFVLQRLEQQGLAPSPAAPKETLIRRVTLDLTGLPPTLDEIDAFLADTRPGAYERLVERLLASPALGERLAIDWLDGARYADTSGYQNDGPRSMWRWRDWVIEALNRNQPFDQFTIEQLAGDLLPDATRKQQIATGFQRNHRGNSEGGIIPEEFAVEYVVDRVETLSTVWLGLTLGCARCHEHKYDPVRQEEFYQLYAFFNNVPEFGRAIKEGNSPPYLAAPTSAQELELAALTARHENALARWKAIEHERNAARLAWEQSAGQPAPPQWFPDRGLVARFSGEENRLLSDSAPLSDNSTSGSQATTTNKRPADDSNTSDDSNASDTGNTFVDSKAPTDADASVATKLSDDKHAPQNSSTSCRFVGGAPAWAEGRDGQAGDFDGQRHVELGDAGDFGYFDKFSFSAWVRPTAANGVIVSRMTDVPQGDGYSLMLEAGRLQLNLVKRWLDDSLRVETEQSLPLDQWTHVAATYDGSRRAAGVRLFVNGQSQPLRVQLDLLNQTFQTTEPLRVGGGHGPAGRFRGQIDELRVFDRVLTDADIRLLSVADTIADLLATPAGQRSANQQEKLKAYYLLHHATPAWRDQHDELVELDETRQQLVESFPTVMVMAEMSPPRVTHVLERGQYDRPGEVVAPGVPDCLPPLPDALPPNRLALARWLVAPSHPLTARVIVNRYWQLFFGVGLVKTAEDFGLQGERPSHPELLDWLAVEMQSSGWDLKHLLRLIVCSATYRQSSVAMPELWQRDPENRWLARGPRYRLDAELARDQALALSGLLDRRLGGPSVKPYQPEGLWLEIATDTDYQQSTGADLYRRSLYTYWKRTVSPPTMATLDAPSRETCLVRRARTNTPLQALVLMNETGYLEAARHLAARVLRDGGDTPQARLTYAFRLATARHPSDRELAVLENVRQSFLDRYRADAAAAAAALSVGESPRPDGELAELASYAAVASLILNLDEVVTKE